MEENEEDRNSLGPLPERIFAAGKEPTGVRVTPYHKANGIRQILNALSADEVEEIRISPFGKLIEIGEKPSFSGRFGRYIISRQLKVMRKHEVWFLFSGKPIRFSIREFALVTGLNCNKFPKRTKKRSSKNFRENKPYWIELFGSLKDVQVSSVVRMLQRKTVSDREVRLKYAYLCILSAVLLPTTHNPRISDVFAEKTKNLEEFFEYPWGRVSFDLLITSIKERKELSLTQNTIALKGFVLAIQLVMIECVPALTEVVQDGSSSEGDDETSESDRVVRKSISPGHARDIDATGKVIVQSIMLDGEGSTSCDPEYQYSDDEDDEAVANMVKLIEDNYPLNGGLFIGGATNEDIRRLREESKAEVLNRKPSKGKASCSVPTNDTVDTEAIASMVRNKLKDEFQVVHTNVASIQESINGFTSTILTNFSELYSMVDDCLARVTTLSADVQNMTSNTATPTAPGPSGVPPASDAATQTVPDSETIISDAVEFAGRVTTSPPHATTAVSDATAPIDGVQGRRDVTDQEEGRGGEEPMETSANNVADPNLIFPNPSFSLGLTQEGRLGETRHADGGDTNIDESAGVDVAEDSMDDPASVHGRGKRQKVPTKALMGEYECDKSFLNRAREAVSDAIYKGSSIDYAAKFSALVDVLKTPFSIDTERGVVESRELNEFVERSTPLTPKVVDVLMQHTRALFRNQESQAQHPLPVFMDTQFVSQFNKLYSKFSRYPKKETYKFTSTVVELLQKPPYSADAVRFYFPFNLDKKYWVGICVDCSNWSVTVLDCNNALRSDFMMNKEVRPIALMFPYLMKQVGRDFGVRECKPMAVDRPRCIPQQNLMTQSAVSSVLFLQAHAVGGIDACKCMTMDVLPSNVERIVVSFYEYNAGPR